MRGEKIGGRADGVRRAGPDVAPSGALEIDGIGEVARRHELRLAHRPRPGPEHPTRFDLALLQDDQRRQQFVPEIVAAKLDKCEARQRPDDVVVAGRGAEVGLESPDAHDDALVDAEVLSGFRQPGALRLRFLPAAIDAPGRNGGADILPDRLDELGLPEGLGDDLRIEGDAGKGAVEGVALDAALLGERPERMHIVPECPVPRGEHPGRRARRNGETDRQKDNNARPKDQTERPAAYRLAASSHRPLSLRKDRCSTIASGSRKEKSAVRAPPGAPGDAPGSRTATAVLASEDFVAVLIDQLESDRLRRPLDLNRLPDRPGRIRGVNLVLLHDL